MPVKVLVVDDMKSFLDLETAFLKRAECTVLKALNGLDALRLAKAEKPDIIFLDLEMPVMNGIECCRFIRSDTELKDTPIVVITASPMEEECRKAGCSSYIRKPIDEDTFLAEIKRFVKITERADIRVNVSIPVNVNFKGSKISAITKDISRHGLLLLTESPFTIGTTLTLDFSLPGQKGIIKAKAMVVRFAKDSSGNSGFGLRFSGISTEHQSLIDYFIEGSG